MKLPKIGSQGYGVDGQETNSSDSTSSTIGGNQPKLMVSSVCSERVRLH